MSIYPYFSAKIRNFLYSPTILHKHVKKMEISSNDFFFTNIWVRGCAWGPGEPRSSRLEEQACERRETVGKRWQASPPPAPIPLVLSTPNACCTSCSLRGLAGRVVYNEIRRYCVRIL
jgi:hypothetical protein